MSFVQKFFKTVLPQKWSSSMETESRSWMVKCSCGYEQSVWDKGGIRWKAKGKPKQYGHCQQCGENSWHTVYYKDANQPSKT